MLTAVKVIKTYFHISGLDDVWKLVDTYVDTTRKIAIERASVCGFPRLVKRLVRHRVHDVDEFYLAHVCNLGISAAASAGNINVMKAFVRLFPSLVITHAAEVAASNRQLDTLVWLRTLGRLVLWPASVIRAASCDLATLETISSQIDITCNIRVLRDAVSTSPDDVVMFLWLLFNKTKRNDDMHGYIVSQVHVSMAQWMVETAAKAVIVHLDYPAMSGDIEYIKWATTTTHRKLKFVDAQGAIDLAASADAIDEASALGRLDIVEYIFVNHLAGCTARALHGAAVNGHLQMIKWLRRTYPHLSCPDSTFDDVCAAGHIPIARYLDACNIGDGSIDAMDSAAANGHIHIFKWLHELRLEGCSTEAMDAAAGAGHQTVVEWLDKHRREGGTAHAMDAAIASGHLATVQYLHEHRLEGCTPTAMKMVARRGDLPTVRWLQENYRYASTEPAIDQAVESGNIALVEWFMCERNELPSKNAMDIALLNEDFPMCEFLRASRASPCSDYGFACTMNALNLYLTGWIEAHYPRSTRRHYLLAHLAHTPWNGDVVHIVFNR